MKISTSTVLSGIRHAQEQLAESANNIANQNSVGFRRTEVIAMETPGGGVTTSKRFMPATDAALEDDMVTQLQAKNILLANLAAFKTINKISITQVDEKTDR
jgi:hypothetical protein